MYNVAIIGVGQTPVAEHWESSLRQLAAEAAHAALLDAGNPALDALYVGNAYGASISGQSQLGALVADYAGLGNIEAWAVEAAEASGAAALRAGYLAVASGAVMTAMVLGVEKSTDMVAAARIKARSISLDADYEAAQGTTATAQAAMLMQRYMHEYNVPLSAFEGFSITAHRNAGKNPNAMFRNQIKPGAFARAPMVATPVNLFDGAPDGDGAATVILTRAERAADMVPQPVRIAGSGAATDKLALHDRIALLRLIAVSESADRACRMAGIRPAEVDLFEMHDSYTILSTLALEALYLAPQGRGWEGVESGIVEGERNIAINTFGGLKARGNPVGATGVYQAVEAALQLRGAAGENQVAGATRALIQNMGGMGSTVITHVLTTWASERL
jgi:acetyl-CoA C-acetyltransferase